MRRHHRSTVWLLILGAIAIRTNFTRADGSAETSSADAADIVRALVARENEIHDLESLHLRMRGTWTRSKETIADERADLEKKFAPETVTPERFPALRPRQTESIELAFDRARMRVSSERRDASTHFQIWDGRQATVYERYFTHKQEGYALDDRPEGNFTHIDGLYWLAIGAHSFWWNSSEFQIGSVTMWYDRDGKHRSRFWGAPEEYVLLGHENVRGRECHVLGTIADRGWPSRRIYVGVDDGFLYGQTSFRRVPDDERRKAMTRIAGAAIADVAAWKAWKEGVSEEKQREAERRLVAQLLEAANPSSETYFDDYRELLPGFRLPLKYGYWFFRRGTKDEIRGRRDLEVVEHRVNTTLPDELFEVEMREGVRVADRRYDPPLFYAYKKEFSPEEWQAILDTHAKKASEQANRKAKQDRRIGKPAVHFPKTVWLNSKPLTWNDLRGKVVVLEFWADWCAPCRNDFEILKSWHKGRDKSGVVVIGVHTPTKSLEGVRKLVDEKKLSYPICIDTKKPGGGRGYGFLSSWYHVHGIPYSVVVDQRGRVAGHGSLDQVLGEARKLVAERK